MQLILIRSLIFLFLVFIQGIAQEDSWQFLGLQNENITSIAINPQSDSILYAGSYSDFSAGTYGKIFKSSDGGFSWDTLVYGVSVNQLEIDQHNTNVIYAALGGANFTNPGILKSIDQGINWFWADSGIYINPERFVQSIAIDPFHPDTLYAGTAGFGAGTLYKSINGGIYWNDIGSGTGLIDGVVSIAIDPQSSNIIYATTAWNCLLYKSLNGGVDWQEINPLFAGYLVYSLVIDPINTNNLYAGASLSGLYKSTNGGLNWFKSDSGILGNNGMDIVLNPLNPEVLYAGTYGHGVYYSTNAGTSWTAMNQGLDTLWLTSLAITTDEKTIFAGTYDGIYRYDFSPINIYSYHRNHKTSKFEMCSNYPNPFNTSTIITYTLPNSGKVTLEIFDITGRKVKSLVQLFQQAGAYRIAWDGRNDVDIPVSNGIYLYRLQVNNRIVIRKMLLAK